MVASAHIYDCGSRLLRASRARITRGRSISVIACARESTAYGNHRPDQAVRPSAGIRPRQPVHRRALRRRHPPRRGPHRGRRAARRPHRQAHRSLARRTSSSSTSRRATTRSGGERSTGRSPRRTTSASAPVWSPYTAIEGPVQPGLLHRRGRGASPLAAGLHRDRLGEHLRAQPVPPADRRAAAPASRRTSRSSASPRSRPIPRPRAPGPAPRSSSTCKRMEILIVGTEYAGEIKKSAFTVMNYLMPDEGVLPMHSAINVGPGRRRRGLLRPVGDRQDDPLGRSRAEPDRRRRARLGRRT